MNYKKLLATAVFTLGAWMSAGAGASTWNPQNNLVYTTEVNGTPYDFSYLTGSFTDNSALLQSQPWWGSQSTATTFATAIGGNLGFPNNQYSDQRGPYFVFESYSSPFFFSNSSFFYSRTSSVQCCGGPGVSASFSYAVATRSTGGVAPEMNASLIPQVGLLLGCLFFLMGRRKENVEPMMTA